MVMSDVSSNSLRAGARFLGVLFQFLAFFTILGTAIAAIVTAHLGKEVGFNGSHDPLVWLILASGVFAASVLAGFGYVLGMLCAIFDRQEWTRPARELHVRPGVPSRASTTEPPPRTTPPIQPSPDRPTPANQVVPSPSPTPAGPNSPSRRDAKSKNWLTRERHFKKRD